MALTEQRGCRFLFHIWASAQSRISPDDGWTGIELALGLTILAGLAGGVPTVLGLAILRYHLYSIDLVINRTLVYDILTLGLAATYGISVVSLQQVLDPIATGSDLAVAGSTLVVAALVQPLRRRIQRVVDRRSYRRKYDAATTITIFGDHLRNAVDLDTLLVDLKTVVETTMQPATVSVWVRKPDTNNRTGNSSALA